VVDGPCTVYVVDDVVDAVVVGGITALGSV